MDPVSGFGVASGAAGVVSLGITVVQQLLKFYDSVKDARDDIRRLCNTAEQLRISLTHLQDSLRKIKEPDSLVHEAEKHILGSRDCIKQLETVLGTDKFRIEPNIGSGWKEKLKAKGRTALYPFRESTLVNLREILEDALEYLDLALTALQLDIGVQLLDQTVSTNVLVNQMHSLAISKQLAETKKQIWSWLNPPDVIFIHKQACKVRETTTGEWLMKHGKFRAWKSSEGSNLWLHGIAGCGKTILCAKVIESLTSPDSIHSRTLFFYFDFRNQGNSTTRAFLASMVAQILRNEDLIPPSVEELYERSKSENGRLGNETLAECFQELIKNLGDVYIVIDALDECSERDVVLPLIKTIVAWDLPHTWILIASRDDSDIRETLAPIFQGELCIKKGMIDADIRMHVASELAKGKLAKSSAEVKAEIEETLTQEAHGMFRWVACQLESLQKCYNVRQIKEALRSLPLTLD